MAEIQVRKKDGSLENWSYDKLLASITKAGVPLEKAKGTASSVEEWAQGSAENGILNSSDIRGKAIELLREVDSEAAEKYETFKKG